MKILSHNDCMKKYKNISNTTLALDCITKTVYMRPGEVLALPRSRDVRYYAGLRKLQMVRDRKLEEQKVLASKEPIKEKSHLGEGAKSKTTKVKDKASNKQEEINENINNDMEIK